MSSVLPSQRRSPGSYEKLPSSGMASWMMSIGIRNLACGFFESAGIRLVKRNARMAGS